MEDQELYCSICRTETLFATPPCHDGHDPGCPELVCSRCGSALLVEAITLRAWLRPRGARVAPQQRRAA